MAEEELHGEEKVKVMIEALKSAQLFVRTSATEQLTIDVNEDPEMALPIMIKEIADPEYWSVRFGIVEAIQEAAVRGGTIPENHVQQLLAYLKDEDIEFVAKLVACLGDVKSKTAVNDLVGLLTHPNDEVRENAASALGKIKDDSASNYLMGLIASDPSEYVRSASIESIGKMMEGKQSTVDVKDIIKQLYNENSSIQTVTAISLGKIRNSSCIIPLIKAMDPTRRDLTADSRQIMLDTLNIFSEQEILNEIKNYAKDDENLYLDVLDEVLFQNPYEMLREESETIKTKLISKYQRQFKRVSNEIASINAFVADVFKKLADINDLEELETIKETIPRKRANLERIEVSKIAAYAWVHNSLYLELKEAENNFKLGISALFELESAVDVKLEKLKGTTAH